MLKLLMGSKVIIFVRRPMKCLLDALCHLLYAILELCMLLCCLYNLNISSVCHSVTVTK